MGGFAMNNQETKPVAVVVNDDPTQLGILAGLLKKADVEARAFEGVEAALAAMDPAAPPDLIVTDLYMPGIDGWRFCRLLRSPEYAAFNEIPILVVSATFAGEVPERIAADVGADAFLPSPVDGQAFIAQARALLSRQEARRLAEADEEAVAPIRRGWCLGSETFRQELLAKLDRHAGEWANGKLRREHGGRARSSAILCVPITTFF
jgi:DNA-binding response OmpR family regulator